MKKLITVPLLLVLSLSMLLLLAGCEDDTVAKYILSNEPCTTADAIETATQPDSLVAGKPVYASISFIESPIGMKYAVEWLLGGHEVYAEEKEMVTDKRGVIVYELPGDKAAAGQLTLRVLYKDKLIFSKELSVK